jgi:tetratricopeptide (TPR) repeat protein
MRFLRALPALILPLAMASRPALAQEAECPVDIYQPAQLTQAGISIGRAAQAGSGPDAEKALRDAMKSLSDEKRVASNPVGAGFLKAQVYILWLHQDGVQDVMTNDRLNAGDPKTGTVDLVAAADSLFKQVEALGPSCPEQTAQWRQAKPWTDRINAAYQFLGSDMIDSAEFYAKRASLLYAQSPFILNAMAQIADKKGDKTGLLSNLKGAIALAEGDTSLAETRRQMMFQYAQSAEAHAMTDGASQKDALLQEALDTYVTLLQEAPAASEAAYAFSAAAQIISLTQDSVRGRELLAPMVATPGEYNDLTLLLAADMARLLNRNDDAMAMYAGALDKNPNIRDATYFLAFMSYEKKDGARMLPLTQKLVELDPSNPDNYLLLSEATKLAAANETDAAKKAQMLKDADAAGKLEASMPHQLLVTQFERRREGALLSGTVANRGKTPKAYTVTMDFLDTEGNVVESVTAQVPEVAPGAMGQFQMQPTKPGIVAYSYKAIG